MGPGEKPRLSQTSSTVTGFVRILVFAATALLGLQMAFVPSKPRGGDAPR